MASMAVTGPSGPTPGSVVGTPVSEATSGRWSEASCSGRAGGGHHQAGRHQATITQAVGPADQPGPVRSRPSVRADRRGSSAVRGRDGADSDGWRHSRSSGGIHPRSSPPSTSSPQSSSGSRPDAPWSSPSTAQKVSDDRRGLVRRPGRPVRLSRRAWTRRPRPRRPGPTMTGVARDLAIDLGTANTLVYAKGRGIVLNQPTVIALNTRTHEVLAVGNEAWQMIGRTPGYIVAVRPLREGAITDFDITERMIRLLLRRAGVTKLNRPRVLICVPSAITSVERRAVKEAARRAGASAAHLIEQPMAAAIGAGLDIHEPVGQHGGRRGGRDHRDGGHLARRGGGLPRHPVRRLRHGCRHPAVRPPRVRDRHR